VASSTERTPRKPLANPAVTQSSCPFGSQTGKLREISIWASLGDARVPCQFGDTKAVFFSAPFLKLPLATLNIIILALEQIIKLIALVLELVNTINSLVNIILEIKAFFLL
jgi:hypothetical protein